MRDSWKKIAKQHTHSLFNTLEKIYPGNFYDRNTLHERKMFPGIIYQVWYSDFTKHQGLVRFHCCYVMIWDINTLEKIYPGNFYDRNTHHRRKKFPWIISQVGTGIPIYKASRIG